jgi:hypothetical protein
MNILIYTDEIFAYSLANPHGFKGEATEVSITPGKYREYLETAERFIRMQTELWQLKEAGRSKNYGTGTS